MRVSAPLQQVLLNACVVDVEADIEERYYTTDPLQKVHPIPLVAVTAEVRLRCRNNVETVDCMIQKRNVNYCDFENCHVRQISVNRYDGIECRFSAQSIRIGNQMLYQKNANRHYSGERVESVQQIWVA